MTNGRFPPTRLFFYPHLSPPESTVWEKFIEDYGQYYKSMDYDIRVGDGRIPTPNMADSDAQLFKLLTQKRIDALGYTADAVHLFEVKVLASAAAVGQVELYRMLWNAEHLDLPIQKTFIICSLADKDVFRLAQAMNILIIEVDA
jgi:hypothetical protein